MMMVSAKRPSSLSLASTIQNHTQEDQLDATSQQKKPVGSCSRPGQDLVKNNSCDGSWTRRQGINNGDRVHLGNNQPFRSNFSGLASGPNCAQPGQDIDHFLGKNGLIQRHLVNDSVHQGNDKTESHYEKFKQVSPENKYQQYRSQFRILYNQLALPASPTLPLLKFDRKRLSGHGSRKIMERKREAMFSYSIEKLRKDVEKVNALVRDANVLFQEMDKMVECQATLQIPVSNLCFNNRRDHFICEPVILEKHKNCHRQIWSMEKFEQKLRSLREIYETSETNGKQIMEISHDVEEPPLESSDSHHLIGVANCFLECLLQGVTLDHHIPIISQQGEINGKLHIQMSSTRQIAHDRCFGVEETNIDDCSVSVAPSVLIKLFIKEASGLPLSFSGFVFCQYLFLGETDPCVVPLVIDTESVIKSRRDDHSPRVVFNHEKLFRVPITEEFMEQCSKGALSIMVWGHRDLNCDGGFQSDAVHIKSRTLNNSWSEVIKRIELWAEVHELNHCGDFSPVEVIPKTDVLCGGIIQLKQDLSRQVLVRVRTVTNSGNLPLLFKSISDVAIGCVSVKTFQEKGLDSYQEDDLTILRDHWSKALIRRKKHLDKRIQSLINKQDKTMADINRERALIQQWALLMEERNAILLPSPGSCIPGAPANYCSYVPNLEEHTPVLFLDLNADDLSAPTSKEGLQAVGINSILSEEQGLDFIQLPIIDRFTEGSSVCSLAKWDSSLHDCVHLNRVTAANERVYMILKVVVRLSHPAPIELVLRKRICINICKKQSFSQFTSMLKNKFFGGSQLNATGATYDVVSNLPKRSEYLEDMETLAQAAISQNDSMGLDGESSIEKYIERVADVERILTQDKLRQMVTVKEKLATSESLGLCLRKTSFSSFNQFQTIEKQELSNFHSQCISQFSSFPNELCKLRISSDTDESSTGFIKMSTQESEHSFNMGYTPSITSSGYASQTVSTLSLEDSASIRSIENNHDINHHQQMLLSWRN